MRRVGYRVVKKTKIDYNFFVIRFLLVPKMATMNELSTPIPRILVNNTIFEKTFPQQINICKNNN